MYYRCILAPNVSEEYLQYEDYVPSENEHFEITIK